MKKFITRQQSIILSLLLIITLFMPIGTEQVQAATISSEKIRSEALGQVGQSYPNGLCLKYVEDFYQRMGATKPYHCCASKSGDVYIRSTSMSDIPIGATVYFGRCGGGPCGSCGNTYYGHVGIYVGNGEFVHATGGRVQKSTLSSWSNKYRGYGFCGNFMLGGGTNTCNCSTSYAGNYIVSTNELPLVMRSGHGASYPQIALIPKGSTLYVSKADGTWAHVEWSGQSGYCSMQYLSKVGSANSSQVAHNPVGMIDQISAEIGYVYVRGWAFDEDDLSKALEIHVYIGGPAGSGAPCEIIKADQSRPDVPTVYPGVGNNHGYSYKVRTTRSGKQGVYIYAINVGGGNNVLLGSQEVHIQQDIEKPKISNVKVTNVNTTGYTVTCTVTDNQGIDRVQFPTWTAKKDQDDLFENWQTSSRASGKKSGNEYTYRVNISDHNNECGIYITHIYAYDKYGKVATYVVPNVEIASQSSTVNAEKTNYIITYSANGGTGAPAAQKYSEGSTAMLSSKVPVATYTATYNANGGTVATKEAVVKREFKGWNTKQNGTGVMYQPGAKFKITRHIALYACYGKAYVNTMPIPTRKGYTFEGWYNGNTLVNERTEISSNCSLSAKWKESECQHQAGNWITIKEATATQPGQKVQKCVKCEAVLKNEIIPLAAIIAPEQGDLTDNDDFINDNFKDNDLLEDEWMDDDLDLVIDDEGNDELRTDETMDYFAVWSRESAVLKQGSSTKNLYVMLMEDDEVEEYISSDPKVIAVSNAGKITAVGTGKATVTAYTKKGASADIVITVKGGAVKTKAIKVNKKTVNLRVGKTFKLSAQVTPSNSTQKITYISSNSKVAKVSSNGKITAKKKGLAVIKVKSGSKIVTVRVIVR